MPRRPIVGGNWKCNPEDPAKLDELVANINACDTSECDVYVCPSTLHVGMVFQSFTNGAKVAPQNCNFKGCGAFTGEMAAEQMASMGIEWCLIGHSERRGEFGLPTPAESSELLATKMQYLLDTGLKCILAIGEPLPVREQGVEAVLAHCVEQLKPCLPYLDADKVVIAYEPVWSIGTGVTASPAQAQETHKLIREWLAKEKSPELAAAIRIQYGGSANAKNAAELSACEDVVCRSHSNYCANPLLTHTGPIPRQDGFLVGGASLKPEFAEIVATIAKVKSSANAAPADQPAVAEPASGEDTQAAQLSKLANEMAQEKLEERARLEAAATVAPVAVPVSSAPPPCELYKTMTSPRLAAVETPMKSSSCSIL